MSLAKTGVAGFVFEHRQPVGFEHRNLGALVQIVREHSKSVAHSGLDLDNK